LICIHNITSFYSGFDICDVANLHKYFKRCFYTVSLCVRDRSGNPFVRNEQKIVADSPTAIAFLRWLVRWKIAIGGTPQ
jgi:hypothetical protein